MMIDRRSFIQGALGVASAFPALSSTKPALRSDYSRLQHQTEPPAVDPNSIAFKIDGWDRCDTATENQLWIRINQSWRTAWR
jgi:hypothetical protein